MPLPPHTHTDLPGSTGQSVVVQSFLSFSSYLLFNIWTYMNRCWVHQRLCLLLIFLSLSHLVYSISASVKCAWISVCMRMQCGCKCVCVDAQISIEEDQCAALRAQTWSKQSLSVCRYTNSPNIHTHCREQRGRERLTPSLRERIESCCKDQKAKILS